MPEGSHGHFHVIQVTLFSGCLLLLAEAMSTQGWLFLSIHVKVQGSQAQSPSLHLLQELCLKSFGGRHLGFSNKGLTALPLLSKIKLKLEENSITVQILLQAWCLLLFFLDLGSEGDTASATPAHYAASTPLPQDAPCGYPCCLQMPFGFWGQCVNCGTPL